MRGSDGVRDQLAELLRYEVTRKIPLLRAVWALDQEDLPDLERVVSGETEDNALTSEGDTWVIVVNPRFLKTHRVDIDDAGRPVYMTRYSCRVLVYAKGDDWRTAKAARDNLVVACRLSLLEYPNLSAVVRGDTGYRLHEDTYTEENGEPSRNPGDGGRVWAASILSIDLDCQETLADGSTRPPIGAVDTPVELDTNAVGPSDPLPETI